MGNVNTGHWCRFCEHQELCDNDCDFCFENSFANSPKAKHWGDNDGIQPRDVFISCGKKYNFDCDVCKHTSNMRLNDITSGYWCSYCSDPPQKLCKDNNCEWCFEKSFASHPMAKYWSPKNKKKPRDVFKSAVMKYIFDCPHCKKEYFARICAISSGGTWCTCLRNKTESKLFDFLSSIDDLYIEKQKKFSWCKNVKMLPYDFCITEYKILIELDGIQHFEQVSNWEDPVEIHKRDVYKMECANNKGYSVIRICQRDVWKDKNDWKIQLKDAIHTYEIPTNIYIGIVYETNIFI